ncbi:MAG TPA: clostripain-related cysteine peptidase [bacterium]|nr:clostripain-related cysteine peptidase [bacterium]
MTGGGVRMMLVLLMTAVIPGAGALAATTTMASVPRAWTVLLYTCADNDLEAYAFRDFAKLTAGRLADDGAVAAVARLATQHQGYWQLTVRGDAYGAGNVAMQRLPPVDMADTAILADFVRQAVRDYPAQRYAIIFQGHGSGWWLHVTDTQYISVARVAAALRQAGAHFAVIGLDMCLMASAETAYELRAVTDYLIAYEDYGPWEGLIEPGLLAQFAAAQKPERLLAAMADGFIARNETATDSDPADVAVIATAPMAALADFLVRHERVLATVDHAFASSFAVDRSDSEPYYQLQDLYALAQAAFATDPAAWREFAGLFHQVVIAYRQNRIKQDLPHAAAHHGLSVVVNGAMDAYDVCGTYRELSAPWQLCHPLP